VGWGGGGGGAAERCGAERREAKRATTLLPGCSATHRQTDGHIHTRVRHWSTTHAHTQT